jgi:hypothetical protein
MKDRAYLASKTQLPDAMIRGFVNDDEIINPTEARKIFCLAGIKPPTHDTEWPEEIIKNQKLLTAFYQHNGYILFGGKKKLQQKKRSPRLRET